MAADALIDFDDQGVRIARASSHPLRREIMGRLLESDAPMCATGIGTAMYGPQFDNAAGSRVLHHLVALEKFGFAEFSHTEKPPKWGKPMKFFRVSEEAREIWPKEGRNPDWSAALTKVVDEALEKGKSPEPADRIRKGLLALANPRGRAILSFFVEMGEASASEAALALSIQPHTAYDQVRRLSNAGLVALCDTDIRRGGLIKIYRPSLPDWAHLVLEAERAAVASA